MAILGKSVVLKTYKNAGIHLVQIYVKVRGDVLKKQNRRVSYIVKVSYQIFVETAEGNNDYFENQGKTF